MQIVPIVADETDDTVIRVIFSDDFEGGKPTVGTMNGTYTYSKVDAEHGQSLKFTSGSGRKYFYGENVCSDSIMDIIRSCVIGRVTERFSIFLIIELASAEPIHIGRALLLSVS